ncbi:MAG: DUF1737 domain-containing protein [Candidatus Thermoplasmatota archaeon]|nr:DUF1737 domain-containing protein [Candidatus Thermoplasmatota archaeon]
MRYDVVTANHMKDQSLGIINHSSFVTKGLISLVNEKLAEGWRPQGGVTQTEAEEGEVLLMQAIVLKTCECDPLPSPNPEQELH